MGRKEWGKCVRNIQKTQGESRRRERQCSRHPSRDSLQPTEKGHYGASLAWWTSGNKLNFHLAKSVLPMSVIGKCLYLNPWALPSHFLPLSCWGGGVREQLGRCVATGQAQALPEGWAGQKLSTQQPRSVGPMAAFSRSVQSACTLGHVPAKLSQQHRQKNTEFKGFHLSEFPFEPTAYCTVEWFWSK